MKTKAESTKALSDLLKPRELYKVSGRNFKPRAIYTEELFRKSATDENLIETIHLDNKNITQKGKLTAENLDAFIKDLKLENKDKVQIEVPIEEKNECNQWEVFFEVFYVDASENFLGNYDNYLSSSLKLLNLLPKIDWNNEICKRKICVDKIIGESNDKIKKSNKNRISEIEDKENVNLQNLINSNCEKENNTKAANKKTLILDLDETLIHSDMDRVFDAHDVVLKFGCDGIEHQIPILIRPGLIEFLEYVSEHFEVIIFTASCKDYADTILDYIDPENKYFTLRLYRDSCLYLQPGIYIKDLSIFEDRSLHNLIIVDNSLLSFANHLNNGILVSSFYYDDIDRALVKVKEYLKVLINEEDVQNFCEEKFKYEYYKDALYRTVRSELRNNEF
jgi:Dullard-like phosphatase family protein